MPKRRRELETDNNDDDTYNTVFIDTNMNTHIALIVSNSDTVFDLKKKIMLEHPQCFPQIREMKILALKVKRKGHFYHLSDSMLLRSAFEGAKKNWFLSADVSSSKLHSENQHSYKPESSNKASLPCITNNASVDRHIVLPDDASKRVSITHELSLPPPVSTLCANLKISDANVSSPGDSFREASKDMDIEIHHTSRDICKDFSSDERRRSDLEAKEKYDISKGDEIPRRTAMHEEDNSRDGISTIQCNNPLGQSLKTVTASKKKRKIKKQQNKDVGCDLALKDDNAPIHASSKDTSHAEIVGQVSNDVKTVNKSISEERGKNSSLDTNKRSEAALHRKYNLHEVDVSSKDKSHREIDGQVSNDLKIGNKDISEEPCKTSSLDTDKRSESGLHRKYNLDEGTAEVPGIQNVKLSKDMIGDVQGNNSLEEASQPRPAAKKKRKIDSVEASGNHLEKHKALFSYSGKEISKPEVIIPEKSGGDKTKVTNAASDGLVAEPSDGCNNEISENRIGDLQGNNSLKEASLLKSAAKKKHKIDSKHASGNHLEANEALVSYSSKEISKPEVMIPENSGGNKMIEIKAALDGLVTEPSDGDHLRTTSATKKRKRKREKKLSIPDDEVPEIVPSSAQVGAERNFKENVEINVGKLSDAATVPTEKVQDEMHSSTSGIPQKEKHDVPIEEVVNRNKVHYSSMGTEICEPDASNVEGQSDATEQAAGLGVKVTIPKNHNEPNVKGFLPGVIEETHNVDVSHSAPKIIVPDAHQFETDQSQQHDKIAKERELSLNHDPQVVLSERLEPSYQGEPDVNIKHVLSTKVSDFNEIVGSGDSGGKKRIKRRAKKSAGRNQSLSDLENANDAVNENSSAAPSSAFHDHLSDGSKKDESVLFQKERKEAANQESVDTSLVSANMEGDNMRKNETELPPLTQMESELSLNHDPQVVVSERLEPSYQGEPDVNIKHVLSTKVTDFNKIVGSGDSGGKKRIKKRSKKSAGRNQGLSDLENANNDVNENFSAAPSSAFDDHFSNGSKKDESVLSQKERKESAIQESVDTSLVNANMEGDNMRKNEAELPPLTQMDPTRENEVHMDEKSRKKVTKNQSSTTKSLPDLPIEELGNEDESLQLNQVGRTQQISESGDKKSTKKTKKKQNSSANNRSYLPMKEQESGVGESAASSDIMKEVDASSKTAKKTRTAKICSLNQLTGSELAHEKDIGIEGGSLDPEQPSRDVDLFKAPSSQTPENGRPEGQVDSESQMEISKCEDDGINFKRYFVPGQQQNEVASGDKVNEATISDRNVKTKKNAKKLIVPHLGTPPNLQESVESFETQGTKKKSHVRNSSGMALPTSSKDGHTGFMFDSDKKSSKVSGNKVEAPKYNENCGIKTPQEVRQPDVLNGAESNRHSPAYPNGKKDSSAASSSGSISKRSVRSIQNKVDKSHQSSVNRFHVAVRKTAGKNIGNVMNNSERKKSMLRTPGSIFGDGSDESSADENGTVNSDASTRTPSNNSSSSGFSEGGSQSILESPRNGSKRKEDVGSNTLKLQSSGQNNMTMDMILRSSSRFKKAKLTASKLQLEDSESQPVDVVPDSQGNL